VAQIAEEDEVIDATTVWPATCELVELRSLTLTVQADELAPQRRKVIFDPVPRVDRIDRAGEPQTRSRPRPTRSAAAASGLSL
jgi:catalase